MGTRQKTKTKDFYIRRAGAKDTEWIGPIYWAISPAQLTRQYYSSIVMQAMMPLGFSNQLA